MSVFRRRLGLVFVCLLSLGALAALPGVATARRAKSAPKNSVTSKSIKNGQVKGSDLAKNAIAGKNVKANSLTGAQIDELSLDFATLQKRVTGACTGGQAIGTIKQDGTVTCVAVGGSSGWSLTGNAGTNPGTNFLGTTDNKALEFKVNSQRALRIEPTTDTPNLIGGNSINSASSGVVGATIAGGGTPSFGIGGAPSIVGGNFGAIGGGYGNSASNLAAIGGGAFNYATGTSSTVAGGGGNFASSQYSAVGGGYVNTANGQYSAVGGGEGSHASGDHATIGGGQSNTASDAHATVGGGQSNTASGPHATVGGGQSNTASSDHATVAGGQSNGASGSLSTVAGGQSNTASGSLATVAGGQNNTAAGTASFAAGARTNIPAGDFGTFAFSDVSNSTAFDPGGPNRFAARATGGVYFVTGANATTGVTTSGVQVPAGGGSWSSLSDRHSKTKIEKVSPRSVLRTLSGVPVHTWSYKTQDSSIRHMGPMAQTFSRAFGLGEDRKHIDDIDAQGVALTAVKGAALKIRSQQRQLQTQARQIAGLQKAVSKLRGR